MGRIRIDTIGSFGSTSKDFSAEKHGHANAVAEAITYLSNVLLPWATKQDHKLQSQGALPEKGWAKEEKI